MPSREHVLATVRMLQEEHLDVRAVTLGVDLCDCADRDPQRMCRLIREKILRKAGNLVEVCEQVSRKYGIPVVNRRLAVSPVANIAAGHGHDEMLRVAQTLDGAAEEAGVDFVGGYSAMVQKGLTDSERTLIETLPDALSMTSRVCASVNAASSRAGINVDALLLLGERILQTAAKTAERDGFGCCKLVVFANIPEDNPFMAGGLKGPGEPETVVNVGVSGPGVVKRAIERLRESGVRLSLADIAEEIKNTSFRVTRTGELIGREVARLTGAEFGIVDLSLAPTPEVGDSVGEILQAMGVERIGGPGSTAALAMLTDAVKKGGTFASSSVGGLSGAFIPVAEDSALASAATEGSLTLEKLEAMTSVCSVGLDMVAVQGDLSPETIAAIIADELAIGVVNRKTTAVRIIPVPGKKPGDVAVFGGLFGQAPVLGVRDGASAPFIRTGGRIPAPLQSLTN